MYNSKKTRYGSRGFIIALFFVCLCLISGTTGCSEKEDGYSQAYDDLFNILDCFAQLTSSNISLCLSILNPIDLAYLK